MIHQEKQLEVFDSRRPLFFEQQNLNGFFYEIPIAKVECEYNGSLEEICNAVQPISIILKPLEPYKANRFLESSALLGLPIWYMQNGDIVQYTSEYRYDVGLTMIRVIESVPQLFVH